MKSSHNIRLLMLLIQNSIIAFSISSEKVPFRF